MAGVSLPLLSVTGAVMWWRKQRARRMANGFTGSAADLTDSTHPNVLRQEP
jgi:hypothetical protein